MNQNIYKINLRDLTERPDVHGNREGKEVYLKLYNIVEENSEQFSWKRLTSSLIQLASIYQ